MRSTADLWIKFQLVHIVLFNYNQSFLFFDSFFTNSLVKIHEYNPLFICSVLSVTSSHEFVKVSKLHSIHTNWGLGERAVSITWVWWDWSRFSQLSWYFPPINSLSPHTLPPQSTASVTCIMMVRLQSNIYSTHLFTIVHESLVCIAEGLDPQYFRESYLR